MLNMEQFITDISIPKLDKPVPAHKERALEVVAFTALILPSMLLSFFATRDRTLGFTFIALSTILRNLGLLLLVCFFIWRDHESFTILGLRYKSVLKEFFTGVALFFPVYYCAAILQVALRTVGFTVSESLPFHLPSEPGEYVLAVFLVLIVAFSEEILFRGYLILRFAQLNKNPMAALILSSFIFSLGHGYQGSAGGATTFFLGIILGLIYLWRRSLIAPIIIHLIINFIPIVILPMLGE